MTGLPPFPPTHKRLIDSRNCSYDACVLCAHTVWGKKINSKPFFEMLKSRTGKMAPLAICQTRFLLLPLLLILVFLPRTFISHLCDLLLSGRRLCHGSKNRKKAKLEVCNTTVYTVNTGHDKK